VTLKTQDRKARAGESSPGFSHFYVLQFVVALLAMTPALSQDHRVLNSISFVGNRAFSAAEIKSWMESREGGPFVAGDLERIVARYVSEGYVFARIDSVAVVQSEVGDASDLSIWVSEGKPAYVSLLQVSGVRALHESQLVASMETRTGAPFHPPVLERDIQTLLKLYERSGHPFARIEIVDISFEERDDRIQAAVELSVSEGSLARLGSVLVEGNTTTKTDVILREMRITNGEILQGDEQERIKRNLDRLQLFSSVSLPEVFINPDGSTGLLIKVQEGHPNRFDGIVGYVPPAGSGIDGYLMGLLNVEFRNLLGTARKLSARWYRENQSTQEVELHYREPWVAGFPVEAEGAFFQRKQDSTYVLRRYSINADVMLLHDWTVGISFSQSNVFPSEGYGARVMNESRTRNFGVSISYDSRNDPETPTSGFRYRTEYYTGVKDITRPVLPGGDTRSTTQRLSFDFEHFLSIFGRQVLAASIYARDVRSKTVEMSDLYRLGGASTLRGYREAQFLGSRLAWSSIEYRLLVGRRSYLFGFLDAGYVFSPDQQVLGLAQSEFTRLGYGVGVRLDSPLGLIGVSVAFGQGDTFSTAKLHVRLVSEF